MSRRLALAAVVAGMALAPALGDAAGPRTELTSVGAAGAADGSSTYWRSLSGSGRLAVFTSNDDALPGSDSTRDVYVRNLETDKTSLVSRSTSGHAVNENAGDDPAIAGGGRFVAFTTSADNLPGGVGGIYVRDLKRKTTKLVSVTTGGDPTPEISAGRPELSADGRFVTFELDDDDFPGADGTLDAYVHDRKTGRTSLISKATDGTPVDTDSIVYPQISGSGRFVVFGSDSDVLPGDDGTDDVFIRDRRRGTTTLVSRTPAGDPVGGASTNAGSVSFNGRRVVFESSDASLGADPSGSAFVRDRKRVTTKPVSLTGGDEIAIGYTASISANGRFVSYESEDDDLEGLDGTTDVFRHDLKTKKTVLVSRAKDGSPGDDDSYYPSISGSGSYVAFSSRADNFSDQANVDAYGGTYVRGPLN